MNCTVGQLLIYVIFCDQIIDFLLASMFFQVKDGKMQQQQQKNIDQN